MLGFEILEMNASDCRSRFAIQSGCSTLAKNQAMDYYTIKGIKQSEKNSTNSTCMAYGG